MRATPQFKPSLIKTMFEGRFTQANAKTKGLNLSSYPTVAWRNFLLLLFALPAVLPFAAQAQVSGTAFRDFNGNGTQGTAAPNLELGASGITVTAYLPNGSMVVTTTDASGAYSFSAAQIPSGTQVRIEFEIPNISGSCGNGTTYQGPSGGTSVQFVSGGANNVNFGISNPAE